MRRIDAHIHLAGDDPETLAVLEELDVRALNICVAHTGWKERQRPVYHALAEQHPDRYAWCTTFDLPDFSVSDIDYAGQVISGIDRDIEDGAVAVKVWKNIGMELRRPDGSLVQIDDPIFQPVFAHLEAKGIPLLMHIGEPRACWQPLVHGTPHYDYYSEHPEWHMHGRTDVSSHEELVAARDRVLERHPALTAIGAHLGSLEYDVAAVARRLEKYPGFAVDVSARLADLLAQPAAAVRGFLEKYQDRVIFGTDVVSSTPLSSLPPERRVRVRESLERHYRLWDTYLAGTKTVETDAQSSPGLGLAPDVLEKLYFSNALRWYPGLRDWAPA